MINLPELIDISKKSKYVKELLDKAIENAFGNRKPLTEILNKIRNNAQDKDGEN